MIKIKPKKRLKKELTLLNVYAIALGTTLSSGLFLLPGLAAKQAGSALILAYIVAAIPMIPSMFCVIELATAMPRSGGAYYFLDRALGPMMGMIGGFGIWFALILKSSFALIGMGTYLGLFFPQINPILVASGFGLFFGFINLFGAKKSGMLQNVLVAFLVLILFWFSGFGLLEIQSIHFADMFKTELNSIISTAGLVYISYVGITKVASVSGEIKNPERNLTLGVILAFFTALIFYIVATVVMVGVIPPEALAGSLTPVADAAQIFAGRWGVVLVTIGAIFSFSSVANAGIMSASRYPMAMSRDHLIPRFFFQLNKRDIPQKSVFATVLVMLLFLNFLDVTKIVKLASAFQLLMFALLCLSVIVMRESKIVSYDPGFKTPFYPWFPLFGIFASLGLIDKLGLMPILFSTGLCLLGGIWYFTYSRQRVIRGGAILHVFSRLGEFRFEGLDSELRGILKEKGLRSGDPFDEIVTKAHVIDLKKESLSFEEIITKVCHYLEQNIGVESKLLEKAFLEGTKVGATPVAHGAALPHLRLGDISQTTLVLVRSHNGVEIDIEPDSSGLHLHLHGENIRAFFFLVSPEDNPAQHLRILAKIAERIDDENFISNWNNANHEQELKEVILREERFLSLTIRKNYKTESLIGQRIDGLKIPEGSLVAMIHRGGQMFVPHGNTQFMNGDRLTIIGNRAGIKVLRKSYQE
jgi:amino acid transporter/mannitol/fructose-specific phosphotransferase system IIA component (Ntr-type)